MNVFKINVHGFQDVSQDFQHVKTIWRGPRDSETRVTMATSDDNQEGSNNRLSLRKHAYAIYSDFKSCKNDNV